VSKLFRIAPAGHERLLALTLKEEPFYSILKSGTLIDDKIELVCSDKEAGLLAVTMKIVCPEELTANPTEMKDAKVHSEGKSFKT
jgi:hypothetical protein